MSQILTYTGKALTNGNDTLDLKPYLPSPGLVTAVNVALYLRKRPLLLMGEPGVGKTCLAQSVAFELLGEEGYRDRFFTWNIKSTSKAKDGLYRYDTFSRLADSQILKTAKDKEQLNNLKLGAKDSYVQPGVLAKAIAMSTKEKRCVILIDEIDKADIDFPNDLLHELEHHTFTIPETGQEIKKPDNFAPPLIIITSNRERELPPAFLRRCLYHYIKFPEDDLLRQIISKALPENVDKKIIDLAIAAFNKQREATVNSEKRPSTSELIDWVNVLNHYTSLKDDKIPEHADALAQLADLGTNRIPFAEVLLKTYETFGKNA